MQLQCAENKIFSIIVTGRKYVTDSGWSANNNSRARLSARIVNITRAIMLNFVGITFRYY